MHVLAYWFDAWSYTVTVQLCDCTSDSNVKTGKTCNSLPNCVESMQCMLLCLCIAVHSLQCAVYMACLSWVGCWDSLAWL